MSGEASWLSLHIPQGSGLPPLLASAQFAPSAYRVHLTDLTSIWAESLDRKAICMRAWKEETSIDPSDTPENMQQFLSCLHSALDQSHRSHRSTSLRLSADNTGDNRPAGGLVLHFECELPSLPALKWTMHLAKCPSATISSELVLPLLRAQNAKINEANQLLDLIKEKDHVISRLLDKLEGAGIGLENVFTGLAVKRKVTRALAEETVRGLAPFERSDWKAAASKRAADEHGQNNIGQLVQAVFADHGLRYRPAQARDEEEAVREWWNDMTEVELATRRATKPARIAERPRTPSSEPVPKQDDDDGDFQVQSTPPRLQTSRAHSSPSKGQPQSDDETADEDEDSLPLRSAATKEMGTAPPQDPPLGPVAGSKLGAVGGKSKLGALGGSKKTTSSPKSKSITSAKYEPETASSDTASNADDSDSDPGKNKGPGAKMATRPASRSGGVDHGVSGSGPTAATASVPGDTSAVKAEDGQPAAQPKAAPRKLGRLGGKGTAGSTEEDGQESEAKVSAPAREETPKEQANRRREELKRERDAALAKPTKKKRRF